MSYDNELALIARTFEQDDIGNQVPVETKTEILCRLKSVSGREFYNAAAAGIRPELAFVVHGYEYSGERLVEFEGTRYNVVRSYAIGFEEVELTVERVVGDG